MANLTGKEIYDMIVEMQRKATAQNGKLTDLALPEDMYETFRLHLIDTLKVHVDPGAKGFVFNGTKIHTGELD